MQFRRAFTALSLCVGLASVAVAAEMIENTEYKWWKGFGKGSFVVLEMTASGNKTTTTNTLVDINDEKATVESKMSMTVNGKPMDLPANKRDIPAKVEKPAGGEAKGDNKAKEGDEEIEVGGKKLKCHYYQTPDAKIWYSDEIPGHMAKMESKNANQVAVKWEKK